MFKLRKLFVQFICLLVTATIYAQSLSQKTLNAFLNDSGLKSAEVGMIFYDLETDEILLQHQAQKKLIPASSHKLLVTSTILSSLGTEYRYETFMEHTGTISSNGILEGNLIIRGTGDPSLGSGLASSLSLEAFTALLVGMLERYGIKQINGAILVDDSYFGGEPVAESWSDADIGNYYGAGVWGFNVHNNLYYLDFRQKSKGQKPVVIGTRPEIENLSFENKLVCAGPKSGDNAYIYGGPDEWEKLIKGSIPSGQGIFTIKGSLPNPSFFYGWYLKRALEKSGVKVLGAGTRLNYSIPLEDRITLYKHYSPRLAKLVEHANLESDNMFCEVFLKTLGKQGSGQGKRSDGVNYLLDYWSDKGLDLDLSMFDGSGLSRSNQVSASTLASILKYTLQEKELSPVFFETLPKSGINGTLGKVFKQTPEEMHLSAKTGSMRSIRSLTGQFETKSGKEVVFSIVINNYSGGGYSMWKKIETFLINLYQESNY
jgi:D-alanyl-D-alanine carboxypeptidase/D-alanyl-D-alanine-endopeptidase (penicillin-binding protein 4)